MCTQNRPAHLSVRDFGFLASVTHRRDMKAMAFDGEFDDHHARASALDMKPTASEEDLPESDDPTAFEIEEARRTVRSKTRQIERASRALDYQHVQRTVAAQAKAEARRRGVA
jgi:hypothetical protein